MHGMWWPRAGLSALAALLVLLIACTVLELVNAQVGFVSIDCGALQENNSDDILWTTDGGYTSLGSNYKIQVNESPPYDTLRYFPDKEVNKNCYVFNTTANFSYLIRAGFLYANYDNLSASEGLPSFALLFGPNLWTNVTFAHDFEVVSHEMIALATSNTFSVCVERFRTGSRDPFISSLEVRQISDNQIIYAPAHENFLMKTNSRINFGQRDNNSVRFPDDVYDRIWESDLKVINGISTYNTTLTTNRTISVAVTDVPSSKVMQTARSPNKTENMSFSFAARFGPGQYYLAFYFAELDNSTSEQRIMDIHIDGSSSTQDLNVANDYGLYKTVELFDKNHTVANKSYTLVLMPSDNSTRPPFINAAESYFLQGMSRPTFDQDVQALEIIKSSFNLSVWKGDPCLPTSYKWPWLDCDSSGNQTRVNSLNLSSMNLRVEIPSALADLSALTSVDLHNNSLTGSIPASLANLRSLTYLDLSFNNLSGDYPAELNNVTTFRITGNPFLCINGSCIAAPTPAQSPTNVLAARSHSRKTGLIVGSVIAAVFVLAAVVLMCMFYKFQSRKKKGIFVARSAHWPPVPPFTEISKSVDSRIAVHTGCSHDVPIFSFADMQTATNNFQNRIGAAGSIGTLYYGTLSDGQEVVVKLLQSNVNHTPLEFLYKVTPLSYVTHKNLLRPIGFCAEIHHLMFIYERIGKGSLYDCLHKADLDNCWLDWKTRVNILQQVAQGLEHLHHSCSPSIIHGNVKSTNVLLSGDPFLAKVSDFGLHELLSNLDTNSGYLDPQYIATKKFTEKSDVYSFGVLVLEVVSGRMPLDTNFPKDTADIVQWVRKLYDRGDHELIVDTALRGTYNASTLSKVVKLALQATEGNAHERPNMAEIVIELKEVSKVEIGHHVVFAELDNSTISSGSDALLSSSNLNGWSEEDVQ